VLEGKIARGSENKKRNYREASHMIADLQGEHKRVMGRKNSGKGERLGAVKGPTLKRRKLTQGGKL